MASESLLPFPKSTLAILKYRRVTFGLRMEGSGSLPLWMGSALRGVVGIQVGPAIP